MYVKTIPATLDSCAMFTDGVSQMAEETENPRINVPCAMVASILINGVLVFRMLIVTLFRAGDLTGAFESVTAYPFT